MSVNRPTYLKCNGVLLSGLNIILKSLDFYLKTFKIFKIQWSSTFGHDNIFKIIGVLLSDMKIILKNIGVLLSRSGVLLSV